MPESEYYWNKWPSPFRVGSHTLSATIFVTLVTGLCCISALQGLYFAFGSGWVAPLVLAGLVFLFFILLKKLIFRNLYTKSTTDADEALIEYLIQHNDTQSEMEEEVEMELLENALHLKQVEARDCMTPLQDVVHIDIQASITTLRQLFTESSLSRIIVTAGGLDNIKGYVHVHQLFDFPKSTKHMVMEIGFVSESTHANELLNKFIKNRTNIACVTSANGHLLGIVTLEDLLEELFGDIEDEYDDQTG